MIVSKVVAIKVVVSKVVAIKVIVSKVVPIMIPERKWVNRSIASIVITTNPDILLYRRILIFIMALEIGEFGKRMLSA